MNETLNKIDFSNMGPPLFSGRQSGQLNRNKYNLDKIDQSDVSIDVLIPEDTYAITSSFFMGLFGKSIRDLGDRNAFVKKYRFKTSERFRGKIEIYIERALREKTPVLL